MTALEVCGVDCENANNKDRKHDPKSITHRLGCGPAKRFGRAEAVSDVSFDVYPGEIFGLLGPNGAGKLPVSVMMDIFKPDAGKSCGGALTGRKRSTVSAICPKSVASTKT
ncbi:MAG: hypothetical protein R2873_33450 [Caldilineaceae bacterium]